MKRKFNEEIVSESEEEYEQDNEDKSEDEEETVQEAKKRLYKEKIQYIENECKRRKINNVDDVITKTLEDEVLEQKGNLMTDVSNELQAPQMASLNLTRDSQSMACCTYSVDGKSIFTASSESHVFKWDAATGKCLKRIKGGKKLPNNNAHKRKITCMAACELYLVTGDLDNKIFVWNIEDMSLNKVLTKHRKPITSLAFRRNTQQLFSTDAKGIVLVWDMALRNNIDELLGHIAVVNGCDSNLLNNVVSCGGVTEPIVKLWKLDKETSADYSVPKKIYELTLDCITMLNERYFVAGSAYNKLYLWDAQTKKIPINIVDDAHPIPKDVNLQTGSRNRVTTVSAMKHTNVFASGSSMSDVRLWKLVLENNTDHYVMRLLFVLPDVVGCVNDLKFNPTGTELLIATAKEHNICRMEKRCRKVKSRVAVYKIHK